MRTLLEVTTYALILAAALAALTVLLETITP